MKLGRTTPTEIDFRVTIRLTWVLKFVLQCFRVHLPQQECECKKSQRNSQGQAQEGPEDNMYPFHRAGHAFSKRFVREIRSQSSSFTSSMNFPTLPYCIFMDTLLCGGVC